jgi:hypothetical protein
MTEHETVALSEIYGESYENFMAAFDSASDQGKCSWITGPDGRRIAALVPVDVLEEHDRQLDRVLSTPLPVLSYRGEDFEHDEVPGEDIPGHAMWWQELLNRAGFRGVQVMDAVHVSTGRAARLKLPVSGEITIARLWTAAHRLETTLQVLPGSVTFRVLDHSADIQLLVTERIFP